MADQARSNTTLAFIVGGLVVAVAVIAYFVLGEGGPATEGGSTNINVETSDTGAGDAGGESGSSGSQGSGGGSQGAGGTSGSAGQTTGTGGGTSGQSAN